MYQPDIGSTRPLLCTAIGRVLILDSAAPERSAILNRLKVEDFNRFALDKPPWEADQKAFAERGYCCSRGLRRDRFRIFSKRRNGWLLQRNVEISAFSDSTCALTSSERRAYLARVRLLWNRVLSMNALGSSSPNAAACP